MIFEEINMSHGANWFMDRITTTGRVIGDNTGITNIFGTIIVIAILFISFATSRIFTFERAFAASSFLGIVVTILLTSMGLISSFYIYLTGIMLAIGILMLLGSRE